MEKKHCASCQRVAWHNPKKDGLRCTFCGFPITSNPAKREWQEELRKRQSVKPRSQDAAA
jgi:ribosomal protein L37E